MQMWDVWILAGAVVIIGAGLTWDAVSAWWHGHER